MNGIGNLEVSDLPRAIWRLNSPPEVLGDFLTMDRSSFGYRRPTTSDEDDDSNAGLSIEELYDAADHDAAAMQNEEQIGNDRVVCLSLEKFRSMLVDNLDVLNHQGKVSWPKRLPLWPRNVPTTT